MNNGKDNTLELVEIFTSVQGEGIHIGRIHNFVRVSGCKLNCKWCDTPSRNAVNDTMTIPDIIAQLDDRFPMCLTGGEPMEMNKRDAIVNLVGSYISRNSIIVETNGANNVPEEWFNEDNICISADFKTPSSGVSDEMIFPYHRLSMKDQIKFVVADISDLSFVMETLEELNDTETNVIITPAGGNSEWLSRRVLTALSDEDNSLLGDGIRDMFDGSYTIRVLPQLHKFWSLR